MKKFYLLCLSSFCFLCGSYAQTAIDPTTGGGFDAGNTFAANGWTAVNSSANKWVVGSATYFGSPNSAYISVDGDPAHYSYDNTTAHISHIYQQVTIPANAFNVSLSYFLKGNIENDADLNVTDGLVLYGDQTLTLPVADVLPGPGADLLLPQFSSNLDYTQQTFNLDAYTGKTILVIFTWVNDGNTIGNDPPASIDDASLTYCIKSDDFDVTGGGSFCTGGSGVGVGLSGSTPGISYQLYKNGTATGTPIDGTGSALDFGPQNAGTYTVIGTSGCNIDYPMLGNAIISENPLPVATAGNNGPLCPGSTLSLTSGGGTTYTWTGPDGFTSTDQNPTIINFTTAASGIYTVTVSNNGCSSSATTNVTLAGAGAIGGSVSSVSICSGANGSLTLTGNSNNPARWEYSTDSTSATWTTIANTTTTQSFSGITVPTFYRAVVDNGCGASNSSIATVGIHNYWTGADITNPTDWNTAANWSDNQVPSTSCDDVFVPNTTNKPILSNAPVATIKNLHIFAGAKVTVNGTGILQIGGLIDNNGIFDVTDGTLEFNGTSQSISGSKLEKRTIKNLVVSSGGTGLTVSAIAGDTLNILESLAFGNNTADLITGDNITLRSTSAATASLGILAAGNTITGDVIVERYIATGPTGGLNHGKSWQLLAVPTQGQTIKESWQEGATGITGQPGGNPHPGFGTMITSDRPTALADGFDAYTSPGPTIKTYNYTNDTYVGPVGTGVQLYNQKGYFLFVRGDRSVFTSSGAAKPTILRTKGNLFTPATPPPSTTVFAGKFESVGNPYASAIDLRKLTLPGVDSFFAVWDPRLGGNYNYGAFQYFYKVNPANPNSDYAVQPGGGTYGPAGTVNNYIQSGQAFFIQATASNGTLSFSENAKAGGSSLFTTPNPMQQEIKIFRTSLNTINSDGSTGYLLDGVFNQFDDSYNNAIDGMDARKSTNTGENLSIKTGGKLLVIERKHTITQNDTIFLNLTGVRLQQYQFHFDAENLNTSVEGFLEDNYLHTRTPVNMSGSTDISFSIVNIPASYAADRFRIVFAPLKALPVTFTSIKAYRQDKNINVEWKVENEMNVKQYEVKRSTDGIHFTTITIQAATANGGQSAAYLAQDVKPVEGYNYYRVKSVDINGKTEYTNVVKVLMGAIKQNISIYPNPITDGMIHLQLENQPAGKYGIKLLNKLGQIIVNRKITRVEGSSTELIRWNYNLAHGMYQLEVTKPDGSIKNINVLY